MNVSDHQQRVRQVLEGNERVYFHPKEPYFAVWYGGPAVFIINSRNFEKVDEFTVNSAEAASITEIENRVDHHLTRRGFDRTGRTEDDTELTER